MTSMKGGFLRDDNNALVITDPNGPLRAHATAARGREGVRRRRARNDLPNPRAVGLTNWNLFAASGTSTGYVQDDLDDAAFVLGGQYGANGHCARQQADFSTAGSLVMQPGRPAGASGTTPGNLAVTVGYTLFGRVKVKVVTCPTDSTVTLQMRMTDASNGTATARTLHTQYPVNSGDIFTLEGFCPATQVQAHLHVFLSNPGAGHVEWRVGNAQIVQEPEGDVPQAVDGYHPTGAWDGTVNASTSYAYVWPNRHDPDTFAGGFNFFHHAHTDNPVDPALLADLLVELGLTHLRASVLAGPSVAAGTTLGVDAVWPLGAANPDWTKAAIWPYIEELRRRGLRYMPIHMVPCAWMTTDASYYPSRLDPARTADFVRLHTSLIEAAPDVIDSIEMWNEPNLVATDPGLTPAVYTALLGTLYSGIKASRPTVKVIGGALSRYQSDDGSGTSIATYLAGMYAAGAKGKMDAISVHPYADDISTADSLTGSTGFHSGFDQCMRQVRSARHAAGDDATPIWATEYGWNLVDGADERRQMQALAMWRGRLARQPDVRGAFFHTLISDRTVGSAVRGYSLLELDTMRRRPAFEMMRRDGIAVGDRWRPVALAVITNPWAASTFFGFSYPGVEVRRDGDLVEVRGAVAKTAGAATDLICTLPDGFIPWHSVIKPITVFDGTNYTTGHVFVRGRSVNNSGQVNVAGGGSVAAGSSVLLNFNFLADG